MFAVYLFHPHFCSTMSSGGTYGVKSQQSIVCSLIEYSLRLEHNCFAQYLVELFLIQDIDRYCSPKGDIEGEGRTLHCLMGHAQQRADGQKLTPQCMQALATIVKVC